jgi:hypothetical protein
VIGLLSHNVVSIPLYASFLIVDTILHLFLILVVIFHLVPSIRILGDRMNVIERFNDCCTHFSDLSLRSSSRFLRFPHRSFILHCSQDSFHADFKLNSLIKESSYINCLFIFDLPVNPANSNYYISNLLSAPDR